MKNYINISIFDPESNSSKEKLRGYIGYLQNHEMNGWWFDRPTSEDYAKAIFKNINEVACFSSHSHQLPALNLWLVLFGKEIKVVNITPKEKTRLTIDEYNAALDLFRNEVLLKTLAAFGLDIITTPPESHIAAIIGEETFAKLALWETRCSLTGDYSHPSDFKLWANVLITALETESKLDASLLVKWLKEDMDWLDEENLHRIGSEFEYGMDLLKYYADHR